MTKPQFYSLHQHPIQFCMILCGAVGLALTCLASFHTYLILTNQTNIEFLSNTKKRYLAIKQGNVFINIYNISYINNINEILGSTNLLLAYTPFMNNNGDGLTFNTRALQNTYETSDSLLDDNIHADCVPTTSYVTT